MMTPLPIDAPETSKVKGGEADQLASELSLAASATRVVGSLEHPVLPMPPVTFLDYSMETSDLI